MSRPYLTRLSLACILEELSQNYSVFLASLNVHHEEILESRKLKSCALVHKTVRVAYSLETSPDSHYKFILISPFSLIALINPQLYRQSKEANAHVSHGCTTHTATSCQAISSLKHAAMGLWAWSTK